MPLYLSIALVNRLHVHSTGNPFAPRSKHSSREDPAAARRSIPPGFIVAIVVAVVLFMVFGQTFDRTPEINYGFFRQQLKAENIANIDLQGLKITGEFNDPPLDPTGKTDRQGEPVKLDKKFTTTASGHRQPRDWTT